MAMVIGPTPPGFGVILPATARTASKSTSPTSFEPVFEPGSEIRFTPTSTTTAPFFMREIMPLIKSKVPDVKLTVVGRNPAPALVDHSKEDSSLIITGRVDDVRPYMDNAAAYIVPLRIGGGTRLKIYEAMAMGKAVVSTTVGAEGLPLTNGVELLLADEPGTFADAVVRVLTDQDYAAQLSRGAATVVRENFGWRQVTERFISICSSMKTVQSSSFSLLSPKHSLNAEL